MATNADAKEALIAAIDLALTTPVAARDRASKWAPRTCTEYLKQVTLARTWWENERREAREVAREAGLDGIPAAAAAAFMPWTPERLVRYVQHLAGMELATSTIRKAVTALKAWHRLHGLPVPDGLPASEALQVHDRTLRAAGREPKRAEPVTLDVLLRLLAGAAADAKRLRGTRDAALIMLTVAGMMLPGELVAMRRRHVERTDQGLRLRPHGDESDVWVDVEHWRIGDEHEAPFCPVECVLAWCDYLDSRDVAGELPLLRGVDQHGNVSGLGAFAGRVDGFGALDERAPGDIVHRLAAAVDVDPAPTMTELRVGGIVHRRAGGTTVAQLAEESGVSSLLRYVVLAEAVRAPGDT
jgi:hypothetical protein